MSSESKDEAKKPEQENLDIPQDLDKAGKQQCPDPKIMLKGGKIFSDVINPTPCNSDEKDNKQA